MGKYCIVCGTKFVKGSNIKFFLFPSDAKLKDEWVKAIGWGDFQPSKNTYICSQHFSEKAYIPRPSELSIKRLRCDAVPTIFSARTSRIYIPSYSQPKEGTRRLTTEADQLHTTQEDDSIEIELLYPYLKQEKEEDLDSLYELQEPHPLDPAVSLHQSLDEDHNGTRDISVQTTHNGTRNRCVQVQTHNMTRDISAQTESPELLLHLKKHTLTRNTQTHWSYATPKEIELRRNVKTLNQKIRRQDKKITKYKRLKEYLKKHNILAHVELKDRLCESQDETNKPNIQIDVSELELNVEHCYSKDPTNVNPNPNSEILNDTIIT